MPPSTVLGRLLLARLAAVDIGKALRKMGHRAVPLRFAFRHTELLPRDLRIEREGAGYAFVFDPLATDSFLANVRKRLAAALYWFLHTEESVRFMTMTGEDGNDPSKAKFAASGRRKGQIAIPDYYWFRTGGFARERAAALASHVDWSDRSDEIVWRGGYNGAGRFSLDCDDRWDLTVNQRFRACAILRGVPGTDVKLHDLQWDRGTLIPHARAEGYFGEPIPEDTWLGRKFALDIDGTVNTWSNFYIRMLFGCCVLKVASHIGYHQWYYDRLTPFEHFVPVAADMRDLLEKIDWVRTHQAEARAIAANAQAFALGYTFEDSTMEAARLIEENWDKPL